MQLFLNAIATMVSSAAAAAQAACVQLLDLSIGSPARAILQAAEALFNVQQGNTYRLLLASRLATSTGSDVDTFVGDYGLTREPAVYAVGNVTLARFVALSSATVLVGSTVRTGDGSLTFEIGADPTNSLWSATQGTSGGYVLPAGTASVTVPATCTTAGTVGNVIVGAISLFGVAMAGIDTVTNNAPLTGGADGESDAALKIRFVGYIASLSKGTVAAVLNAIQTVQAGLTCLLQNNTDPSGAYVPGNFVVIVDDGSGHPPSSLLSAVYAAVDLVRPITVSFCVQPPVVVEVGVALTLTVSSGNKTALIAAVQSAVATYINAITVGGTVTLFGTTQAVAVVNPAVSNVSSLTLNGLAGDLSVAANAVPKCQYCTVS